ncbi:MAG TPA: hypothetical protein PKD92_12735, partial [Novosphingobium sp.]|nr:hypothetical protein [Novosphingobium sp.]
FFAAEADSSDFAPDEAVQSDEATASGEAAASAGALPSGGAPQSAGPPLPGAGKPADPGPTPAQIARLIEASRERSGARSGGD